MPAYLDNAATSFPKPPRVYERLRGYLEEYGGCPGRGSYVLARQSEAAVEAARSGLAALFGISEASRIVLTLNATDALNLAIKGAIRPGDHVVTTVFEHNSVSRPLTRLERRGLIRLTRVGGSAEGFVDPEDIRRALSPRTKLVAVIHGSNVTGAVQPIAAIGALARAHGALLLVDAAQTAGAVPIDVEACAIDLLAFPGHKALLGLPGTGGLYIGPRAQLSPWREGGTGIWSELPLQPEAMPYAFEAGSPNTLGLAGLRDSVQFLAERGIERIRAHELGLVERLVQGLRGDARFTVHGPSQGQERIAVVSVSVQGLRPQAVAERLDAEYGIAVRAGLHCAPGAHRVLGTFPHGTVRISPGVFTQEAEIDRCLEALRAVAERALRREAVPQA